MTMHYTILDITKEDGQNWAEVVAAKAPDSPEEHETCFGVALTGLEHTRPKLFSMLTTLPAEVIYAAIASGYQLGKAVERCRAEQGPEAAEPPAEGPAGSKTPYGVCPSCEDNQGKAPDGLCDYCAGRS